MRRLVWRLLLATACCLLATLAGVRRLHTRAPPTAAFSAALPEALSHRLARGLSASLPLRTPAPSPQPTPAPTPRPRPLLRFVACEGLVNYKVGVLQAMLVARVTRRRVCLPPHDAATGEPSAAFDMLFDLDRARGFWQRVVEIATPSDDPRCGAPPPPPYGAANALSANATAAVRLDLAKPWAGRPASEYAAAGARYALVPTLVLDCAPFAVKFPAHSDLADLCVTRAAAATTTSSSYSRTRLSGTG